MRTSVRTAPELSGCNYILFFNTFRGSRTVGEAGTNADIARLYVYLPRGQRGTNIGYVCELATLLVVLRPTFSQCHGSVRAVRTIAVWNLKLFPNGLRVAASDWIRDASP